MLRLKADILCTRLFPEFSVALVVSVCRKRSAFEASAGSMKTLSHVRLILASHMKGLTLVFDGFVLRRSTRIWLSVPCRASVTAEVSDGIYDG